MRKRALSAGDDVSNSLLNARLSSLVERFRWERWDSVTDPDEMTSEGETEPVKVLLHGEDCDYLQ